MNDIGMKDWERKAVEVIKTAASYIRSRLRRMLPWSDHISAGTHQPDHEFLRAYFACDHALLRKSISEVRRTAKACERRLDAMAGKKDDV